MNPEKYVKMTKEEKANFYFQKFKNDFDNWECEPSDTNCIENRLTLLKLKYLPKHESESIRDLYAYLCDFSIKK